MPVHGSNPPWPVLDPAALYGLPGKVVQEILPHTESDPVALLVSFLTAFGNAVGPLPAAKADAAQHPARLFTVLVGDTSRARKGTSWRNIKRIFEIADPTWVDECLVGGMATGEGLISTVKDPNFEKRALCIEEEFARTLIMGNRGNNILSQIVREAYDNGNIRTMTKKPMIATGAHIGIIGHCTMEELTVRLSFLHRVSGFANRFLWFATRRSKLLPSGGSLDENKMKMLSIDVVDKLADARDVRRLTRTPHAERLWEHYYKQIDAETLRGEVGALTARSEAHLLRLSVAYALTDATDKIDVPHLEAAWALLRYSVDTLIYIFGFGDPLIDQLFTAIRESKQGLSLTQQNDLFSGNVPKERLQAARDVLERQGYIVTASTPTAGRSLTVSKAVR